jgi:hypothetical protein
MWRVRLFFWLLRHQAHGIVVIRNLTGRFYCGSCGRSYKPKEEA